MLVSINSDEELSYLTELHPSSGYESRIGMEYIGKYFV